LTHRHRSLLLILITAISFLSPLMRLHDTVGLLINSSSNSENLEQLVTTPLCGGYVPSLTIGTLQDASPALAAVGGGDITPVYSSSFPVDSRSYAQTLFDLVYPEIKRIYGDPSNTITVTISYDPSSYPWNFYYGATHTITLSQLPPSIGTSSTWDAIFTHELIHSFHDAIALTGGSWAEEGMTEAATEIVAMNLAGRRDIVFRDPVVNLKYYDVWSYMGSNVLGGGPDFTYKVNPDLSYRISAAMFFILSAELSTNPSNPYDFLGRLNSVIYSGASTNPIFDDRSFKLAIRQSASGKLVEGQLADVWLSNQPITSPFVRTGFQLGIYTYRPENPTQIWAITFSRQPDAKEVPLSNIEVSYRLVDSSGRTINTGSLATGPDGMGSDDFVVTPLPVGGYQIIASTIFNGINYTTKSYAFSQGNPSFLIDQADSNIYGVTLDSQGRSVPGNVSVVGGIIGLDTQGAFKIEAASQTPPYEFTLTSGTFEKRLGKPNPYTRVAWTNSTVPTTTEYTVTVNVNGLPAVYSTTLRVDGSSHGTSQGSGSTSLTFDAGTTHMIQVDSYVNASSTIRYHCGSYLQTVTSQANLSFSYLAETYSTFQQSGLTKPISVTIDGSIYVVPVSFWWANGSTHTFTYQSNLTDALTRYLLTGATPSSPLTVTGPLSVTGFYKVQYFLNVSTVPISIAAVNGSGWYDAGSKVELEAPIATGYTFQDWIIDNTQIPGNPIQLSMDTPHNAVAEYQSGGVYEVIVTALYISNNEETEAAFTWDGQTYVTPHTFTGLSGSHNLVMSSTDKQGHIFARWQDSTLNTTSRTISAGGTYAAWFGVLSKNFTITASPEQQRIGPGQSVSFTIKLDSPNGPSPPVTLGVKGLPINSNSTFKPRTLTPPGTSSLLIDTKSTTPVGSYILTITATGDGQVRTALVRLSMGACIIATTAYGSELSPEVQFLRGFRENTVRKTFAGENFMMTFNMWYYSFSPSVADTIAKYDFLKMLVRVGLYPLIGVLHISAVTYPFFECAPELGVFISGTLASFLIGTVYFAPIFVPVIFRRRKLQTAVWILNLSLLFASIIISIIGEVTLDQELMMLATPAFVVGILITSILTLSRLPTSVGRVKKWYAGAPRKLISWLPPPRF
jgi:hypothetical protein